jgi:hypothetical protein
MEPIKDSLEDLLDQVAWEIAREVEAQSHPADETGDEISR